MTATANPPVLPARHTGLPPALVPAEPTTSLPLPHATCNNDRLEAAAGARKLEWAALGRRASACKR